MTKTNKKRNSKDRRIAIASIIVAGMIVAGSTFAWFTSKDEVTNRLTAHADYGVSIVEDFTPPEDWTPGQKINKDVSAVNTGNVDAYVRLAILNDLQLNVKGAGAAVDSNAVALPSVPDGEKGFVELNFTAVNAVDQNNTSGSEANAVKKNPNEVSTLQAGGTLVVKAGVPVKPTDAQNVSAGDDVSTGADDYDGADQFKPTDPGLYLFKRTVYEGDNSNQTKYSGYFYAGGKYYALETEKGTIYSTATVTEADGIVTAVTGVKLATTKDVTIKNTDTATGNLIDIKWYSTAMGAETATTVTAGDASAKWIQLTYEAVTGDPIKLDIELASDWATNWTYVQTNNDPKVDDKNDFGYFYYNAILPAGNTTPKLIDSVTLDSTVTQDAYNDLVYDLSVVLDSIQITPDEAKTAASYTTGVNGAGWGATATYTNDTNVSWS